MNLAEQVTENQEWLMGRHSRTVGQILDVIELRYRKERNVKR